MGSLLSLQKNETGMRQWGKPVTVGHYPYAGGKQHVERHCYSAALQHRRKVLLHAV
jgi:hypothetical protein